MNAFLNDILIKVIGLECIVIADRDGVPIIKASAEKIPDTALRSNFLSTFGMASFQGSKLGLGENNTIICMYSTYQVVQMDMHGLIVTFIGSKDCNTGHMLSLSKDVEPLLVELRNVLNTEYS
uniref:Putative mitogen-activated protein kinase kinase 1 n=2 Tax=Panstrongylus TaxID=65342 RepID=A0A224XPF0_9HEMI